MTISWESAFLMAFLLCCLIHVPDVVLGACAAFPFDVLGRMVNSIIPNRDDCLFIFSEFVLSSALKIIMDIILHGVHRFKLKKIP